MGDTAVGPTDLGPGRRQPLDPLDCGGLELDGALDLLAAGELTVTGRMTDASNATLYCEIAAGESSGRCVYKPIRGERALWDFPDGTLAARELAAYEVSAALGLGIVPPTIMRDGPFGPGMVQLWIDTDVTVDLVALTRSDDPQLRRIALFDAVINNADRKGGHLLPAPSGRVHGIDHGVTFHAEGKLRTLLWTWRGRRLSAEETALLRGLAEQLTGDLGRRLEPLLTVTELTALDARLDDLLDTGRFPLPSGDWPPIPWPPF